MSITFNCPCGKVLSARESDAGKKGICPHCGKSWKISSSGRVASEDHPGRRRKFKPRDVENFLFNHERAIWVLAVLTVVAVGAGFFWYTGIRPWASEEAPPTVAASQAPQAEREEDEVAELLAYRTPATEPLEDPVAAISALNPVPIGPDSPAWMTDFDAFAEAAKKLATSEQSLQEAFTNHEIRWTVTYDSMHANAAMFFEEAAELLAHRPPIQVWALLAPNEVEKIAGLESGTQLVIHGVMGHVTTPRTQNYPAGVFRLGPKYCVIESIDR